MKTCTKCGGSYPATTEHFYKDNKYSKSGLRPRCKKCMKQEKKEYLSKPINKTREKKKRDERRAIIKNAVLKHYSFGKMTCQCCGEKHIEFLALFRLSNAKRDISSYTLYLHLMNNDYPEGYVVLCRNCINAKLYYGECPHIDPHYKKDVTDTQKLEYRMQIREEVFKHYGKGKIECVCCGENEIKFLNIDHINNNGAEERKLLRDKGTVAGGVNFYNYLKLNDYPEGYQVLCSNCNISEGMFGYCPHNTKV